MIFDQDAITMLVSHRLKDFYAHRISAMQGLKLKDVLRRKNPYLFRAVGTSSVAELVSDILHAYMSSSDETIFGNCFFEPLALDISQGEYESAAGADIRRETETALEVFAVKSGTSVFNSQSKKKQQDEFNKIRSRLLVKLQKKFDPIVGYSYGHKAQSQRSTGSYSFTEIAGQAFWFRLSGDEDCYLKIIRGMEKCGEEHRAEFKVAWDHAVNRFSLEFSINFCDGSGSIDWDKLVRYNSSANPLDWEWKTSI